MADPLNDFGQLLAWEKPCLICKFFGKAVKVEHQTQSQTIAFDLIRGCKKFPSEFLFKTFHTSQDNHSPYAVKDSWWTQPIPLVPQVKNTSEPIRSNDAVISVVVLIISIQQIKLVSEDWKSYQLETVV